MLNVVEAYVSRWKMKNRRTSKVHGSENERSKIKLTIGEETVEEVEEFIYLLE